MIFVEREDDSTCPSDNSLSVHKGEKTRVKAVVARVAHHEILLCRHCNWRKIAERGAGGQRHYPMPGVLVALFCNHWVGILINFPGKRQSAGWLIFHPCAVEKKDVVPHLDGIARTGEDPLHQPRAIFG